MNKIQKYTVKEHLADGGELPETPTAFPPGGVDLTTNTHNVALQGYLQSLNQGDVRIQVESLMLLVKGLYEDATILGVDLDKAFDEYWAKEKAYSTEDARPLTWKSNLVVHATTELKLIGEDEEVIEGVNNTLEAWAEMGHSGGSHFALAPVLQRLLNFEPLTPLTDNPLEWFYHGAEVAGNEEGLWQNRRNSRAFSTDGGKTYWLTSEGSNDGNRFPLFKSQSSEVISGE